MTEFRTESVHKFPRSQFGFKQCPLSACSAENNNRVSLLVAINVCLPLLVFVRLSVLVGCLAWLSVSSFSLFTILVVLQNVLALAKSVAQSQNGMHRIQSNPLACVCVYVRLLSNFPAISRRGASVPSLPVLCHRVPFIEDVTWLCHCKHTHTFVLFLLVLPFFDRLERPPCSVLFRHWMAYRIAFGGYVCTLR